MRSSPERPRESMWARAQRERLLDTSAGRAMSERLAARGVLWPLMALFDPPPPAVRRQPLLERWSWSLGGGELRRRLVTARSDVCIEGFPRSANTYTVAAFRQWNRDARVAHHLHAAFHVRRAVRLAVPCCVLVRRPFDAIASVVVMTRGRISADTCFRGWLRFHRRILPVRDGIVICRFEELTSDPSIAPRRLNERFETSFQFEPMTPASGQALLRKLEARARRRAASSPERIAPVPSVGKEHLKAAMRAQLAEHPMLAEAEAVYAELVGGRAP